MSYAGEYDHLGLKSLSGKTRESLWGSEDFGLGHDMAISSLKEHALRKREKVSPVCSCQPPQAGPGWSCYPPTLPVPGHCSGQAWRGVGLDFGGRVLPSWLWLHASLAWPVRREPGAILGAQLPWLQPKLQTAGKGPAPASQTGLALRTHLQQCLQAGLAQSSSPSPG